MNLYDNYNRDAPLNTDELWKKIDSKMGVMDSYVDGTHAQASWIHINTNPVYWEEYLERAIVIKVKIISNILCFHMVFGE